MLKREDGFTLIELIAVMIILGIIASVVAYKFMDLTNNASDQVITTCIAELNTREKHTWMNAKLEGVEGVENIETYVLARVDRQIGEGAMVSEDSTQITIRGSTAKVVRIPATRTEPAIWSRQ